MNWFFKISSEKIMFILRGPSGSGKSSLIKELKQKYSNIKSFSTDDFFTSSDGKYNFDKTKIAQAHLWNQHRVENELINNSPYVVIDNTNTKLYEIRPYIKMALKHGYKIQFLEPNWHKDLKTPEGKWNYDFISKQQENKDRQDANKSLNKDIVKRMIDNYDYNPTIESILKSKAPWEK